MGQKRKERRDQKRTERQNKREQRREDRQDRKEERRQRREDSRENRQERRQERKSERRNARQERIDSRQRGRTERVESRQDAREEINIAKWKAKAEAYENGIDPDSWKGDAVNAAGGIIGGLLNKNEPMGFPEGVSDFPPGDFDDDFPTPSQPFYMMPIVWIAALAAFFLFKSKRK